MKNSHPERFILHTCLGAVAICTGIALVLIPSQRDLAHRAFVDGDWERLRRIASSEVPTDHAAEPFFFDFLKACFATLPLQERLQKHKPTPEEKRLAARIFDASRAYYDKTTEPKERTALLSMMFFWYAFADRAPVFLDLYRKYASTHPEDPKVQTQYMKLAFEAGARDEAFGIMKHILALSPNLSTRRLLAEELEWHGMVNEAFEQYLPLAADGDEPSLLRILALNEGLFRNRETGEALASFIRKTGKSIYDRKLAEIEVLLGNYDEAITVYKRMLERKPDDVRFLVKLGKLQKLRLNLEGAEATFLKAARLSPNDADIQRALASITSSLGHFEESYDYLQRVITLDPQPEDVRQFTQLSLSLGRRDEAIKGYENIIRLKDANPLDYRFLANLYYEKNRPLEVERVLEEGVHAFPKDSFLRSQLVWSLSDLGKTKEALQLLESGGANSATPDMVQLHLTLLIQNKQLARALEVVRTQMTPDLAQNRDIALLALDVCERSGATAEACQRGQQLYALYPEDRDVILAFAQSLSAAGKNAVALSILSPLLAQKDVEALRTAADDAASCGRLREAETFRAELVNLPESTREDWMAYGDLLRTSGKGRLSRWAYRQALSRLGES